MGRPVGIDVFSELNSRFSKSSGECSSQVNASNVDLLILFILAGASRTYWEDK